MDSILTLIAFFVVIFIFWTLASWLLPFILPIIIVFWIISLFTQRRHVHVHTYNSTQNQNEQPKSEPKHGAIVLNIRNMKMMEMNNDLSQQCWL